MSRRRAKTSPIEDLIAEVALLPWWACIALALASYLVLHCLALEQLVTRSLGTGLASVGWFVAPIACQFAAGVSATQRRRRSPLVASVTHATAPDALAGISWEEFERLVGEDLRMQCYKLSELGGAAAPR